MNKMREEEGVKCELLLLSQYKTFIKTKQSINIGINFLQLHLQHAGYVISNSIFVFRIYTVSLLTHAWNINRVHGTPIYSACWSINVYIAEKQIVCATSKYCNRSRDHQWQNCLIDQSFDCAIADIFPKYAPRQQYFFAICNKKCIVEDIPKIYKNNNYHHC